MLVYRDTLANVFLLIDASVPTQALDLACANWLVEAQVPLSLIFTKTDKRKKRTTPVEDNINSFMVCITDWPDTHLRS
jgi:GTP-binding protein